MHKVLRSQTVMHWTHGKVCGDGLLHDPALFVMICVGLSLKLRHSGVLDKQTACADTVDSKLSSTTAEYALSRKLASTQLLRQQGMYRSSRSASGTRAVKCNSVVNWNASFVELLFAVAGNNNTCACMTCRLHPCLCFCNKYS